MAHHIDPAGIQETDSRLGSTTKLKGTLRFRESVTIEGRYEGTIEAEGFLFIKEGAEVRADIRAHHIIVGGTIHGNVQATGEVEMLPSCVFHGNVRASRIRIADGVVFDGRCEMLRSGDSIDVFSGPLDQLRSEAAPAIEP